MVDKDQQFARSTLSQLGRCNVGQQLPWWSLLPLPLSPFWLRLLITQRVIRRVTPPSGLFWGSFVLSVTQWITCRVTHVSGRFWGSFLLLVTRRVTRRVTPVSGRPWGSFLLLVIQRVIRRAIPVSGRPWRSFLLVTRWAALSPCLYQFVLGSLKIGNHHRCQDRDCHQCVSTVMSLSLQRI